MKEQEIAIFFNLKDINERPLPLILGENFENSKKIDKINRRTFFKILFFGNLSSHLGKN